MDLVTPHLANTASFFFMASLKGTLLILAVLLIQKVAGRFLSAAARHLLWFPVALALVMPLGFELTLPARLLAEAPVPQFIASVPVVETSRVERMPSASDSSTPPVARSENVLHRSPTASKSPSVLTLLAYLWLAGVVAVLCAVAVSSYRFSRVLRRAIPPVNDLQQFLRECMAQTACTSTVSVRHSTEIRVPMIAGLLRPVLLLPAGLEQQLSRAQLRHVFVHELMHLRRGDIASNWIVTLVQALHWFNPAVWYAFFCMRQDRELACDAATLQRLDPADRASYGHTLLCLNDTATSQRVPALALGMLETTSHLHRRIGLLVQVPRKWHTAAAALVLLPLAALALGQPVRAPAEPRPVTVAPTAATEPAAAVAPEPSAAVRAEPAGDTRAVTREPVAPARPVVRDVPAVEAQPVERAQPASSAIIEAASVAAKPLLLAQVDTASAPDAFAPEPGENVLLVAAVSTPAPEAPVADSTAQLASVVRQMADGIARVKADKLGFIEQWNAVANECAERKDASLFGTFSKACRDVRAVQIRGDVFRFMYTCYYLDELHSEQWNAYQEAAARSTNALEGVATVLEANEEQLLEFCSKNTYAERYPGFGAMFADAEKLKYYDPRGQPGYVRNRPGGITNFGIPNPYYDSGVWNFSASGVDGARLGGGSFEYIGSAVSADANAGN
jgi:beta-lactamase regulating signal transducer with metallopeptidase domain